MNSQLEKIYQGIITEEEEDISLVRLCHLCNHSQEEIIELVNEGIIEPLGQSKHDWHFTYLTIERVKKARRLRMDFELNTPSVGLVLHLLDRINELESMFNQVNPK